MKKIYILFYCFIIIFQIGYTQERKSLAINDSLIYFEGDIKLRTIELYNVILVQIELSDSITLNKEYSKNGELYRVYQTDKQGYLNGNYYFYDANKKNHGRGIYENNRVKDLIITDLKGDTVGYEKTTGIDSKELMLIENEKKIIWETNKNLVYNGYYYVYDKNNNLIEEKRFLALKENAIKDSICFIELCNKYGITRIFRGSNTGVLEMDLPIGIWKYFNSRGEIVKTTKYEWGSCINEKYIPNESLE